MAVMAGAHRVGTPVAQLLTQLHAERQAQLPGIELSGPISDRVRAMAEDSSVEVNPERGTEPPTDLPSSAYSGHRLSGRARRPWFRRPDDDQPA